MIGDVVSDSAFTVARLFYAIDFDSETNATAAAVVGAHVVVETIDNFEGRIARGLDSAGHGSYCVSASAGSSPSF